MEGTWDGLSSGRRQNHSQGEPSNVRWLTLSCPGGGPVAGWNPTVGAQGQEHDKKGLILRKGNLNEPDRLIRLLPWPTSQSQIVWPELQRM